MLDSIVTLTKYVARPLRGSGPVVAIMESRRPASRLTDGSFIGIFRPGSPTLDDTAQAILRFQSHHPATREASGLLRLDRNIFVHLDAGVPTIYYVRVPDTLV